jgi:hypothetical protein
MLFAMPIYVWFLAGFLLLEGLIALLVIGRGLDSIESRLTQIYDAQIEANFKNRQEMREIQQAVETISTQLHERDR